MRQHGLYRAKSFLPVPGLDNPPSSWQFYTEMNIMPVAQIPLSENRNGRPQNSELWDGVMPDMTMEAFRKPLRLDCYPKVC